MRITPIDSAVCALSILSEPSDASVYIDGALIGRTPLELNNLEQKTYSVKVVHETGEEWASTVPVLKGAKVAVTARFTPRMGTISIIDVPEDAEVIVDGILLPPLPTTTYELPTGYHNMEIRSPSLHRFAQKRIHVSPYIGLGVSAELGYPSQKSFWLSLLLPGVGQIYDRSVYEGIGYAAGTAGLMLMSAVLNTKYQTQLDAYRASRAPYLHAMTEADISLFREQMNEKKGSADKAYRVRNITYSALIGLYACNLVDVLLFHTSDDRITAFSLGKSAHTSFMIVPDAKQLACRFSVQF